jgi:hypothetical protein
MLQRVAGETFVRVLTSLNKEYHKMYVHSGHLFGNTGVLDFVGNSVFKNTTKQ